MSQGMDFARARPRAALLRVCAPAKGDSGHSTAPLRAGLWLFSGNFEGLAPQLLDESVKAC